MAPLSSVLVVLFGTALRALLLRPALGALLPLLSLLRTLLSLVLALLVLLVLIFVDVLLATLLSALLACHYFTFQENVECKTAINEKSCSRMRRDCQPFRQTSNTKIQEQFS